MIHLLIEEKKNFLCVSWPHDEYEREKELRCACACVCVWERERGVSNRILLGRCGIAVVDKTGKKIL